MNDSEYAEYVEYVHFYAALCILMLREEYAEYAKYPFQYECSVYSAYLLTYVSSILGRLPLVPVSNTGTLLYKMRREAADFPGASCYNTKDGKDSAGGGT